MKDRFGRNIRYMRISVTDRCNLRCIYCMPTELKSISHENILRYEEILSICKSAVEIGITRFKITGGEPLVRKGCADFIYDLKNMPGVEEVTLTTNAILLEKNLKRLKEGRIDGINISLDTCNEKIFKEITGHNGLSSVLESLKQSIDYGIKTKVNCVPLRGYTENQLDALIDIARKHTVDVRFIEIMPIGYGKNFEGVKTDDIKKYIFNKYKNVKESKKIHGNGPANYIEIDGFKGSLGFIDAVHDNFCDNCNRVRLTADGYLKSCLFYANGVNLMKLLREDKNANITNVMQDVVFNKHRSHYLDDSLLRDENSIENKKMNEIGG